MSDLISRKEAIKAVKFYETFYDPYPRVIEALEDLPSAQPDVPDTNVGDLISRQDAIDAVKFGITYAKAFNKSTGEVKELFKEGNKALNEAAERLKELPSAQPETAKRIVGKSRDGMTLWYQCDMCNEPVDVQDNYCRGCGRRLIDE